MSIENDILFGDDSPDLVGKVLGFRSFHLVGDGEPAFWKKGINRALCDQERALSMPNFSSLKGTEHHPEIAPHKDCSCGLYSYHDPQSVRISYGHTIAITLGWGRMMTASHGWRAEYAEIKAISDKRLADKWDIPYLDFKRSPWESNQDRFDPFDQSRTNTEARNYLANVVELLELDKYQLPPELYPRDEEKEAFQRARAEFGKRRKLEIKARKAAKAKLISTPKDILEYYAKKEMRRKWKS